MRTNGTFKYTIAQDVEKDPDTGFYKSAGSSDMLPGCDCQIDKSIPAKQIIGTDGQMHSYTYDVFIPKSFSGNLAIGGLMQITTERGNVEEFAIQGVDDLNRRYIEVWG